MRFFSMTVALCAVSMTCRAGTPPIPVLPLVLPTPNEAYLLYSDPNPLSPHFFPASKAVAAAAALDRSGVAGPGNPRGYHEGYMNLDFRYPYFSVEPKSVYYYDCKEPDKDEPGITCDNGMAPVSNILMPTSVYAGKSDSCIRGIQGHELFHHVEFAYANAIGRSGCGSVWGNTACEGQARALQDKIYLDLDLDPAASCVAEFDDQVNAYLNETNQYLWASSYDGALFWTYLMEQHGQIATEPGRGADFITTWWDNAEAAGEAGADAFAITDDTIADYDPARNVFTEFRAFAIANLVKDFDLSTNSAAFVDRYSYRDEDPVLLFNQMDFNNVNVEFDVDIDGGADVTTLIGVQYFGARYLRVDVQDCAPNRIIRLDIDAADTTTAGIDNLAGYGVVVVRDDRPIKYYLKFAVDWTLSTFQSSNRYDEVYLVVAPVAGFWIGNVTASCDAPETTLDLDFPLVGQTNPAQAGHADAQAVIQVDVVPGIDRDRPFVGGLARDDFSAVVGGLPATVLDVTRTLDSYQLQLKLPVQPAAGRYDLEVQLGESAFVSPDSIVHGEAETDVMIALDTSTSMLLPPDGSRLNAVREAGQFLVEAMPEVSRMGLISFAGNDTEPNTDAQLLVALDDADSILRNRVKVGIGNLASGPNRFTSIGDALQLAMNQFAAGGGVGSARHLVLLSDGSENEGMFYADVRAALIATGIRVHTVALGPLADQGLLSRIARDTGGEYRYVAVQTLATDVLDLHAAFSQVAQAIMHRQILGESAAELLPGQTLVLEQVIGQSALLLPAMQKITAALPDRAAGAASGELIGALRVFRPDGSEVVDGLAGARIIDGGNWFVVKEPQLMPGRWRYEILGGADADSARVEIDVSAWTSDRHLQVTASAAEDTDNPPSRTLARYPFHFHIALYSQDAVAEVSAEVRACDGSVIPLALPNGTADGAGESPFDRGLVGHRYALELPFTAGPGSPTGFPDDLNQPGQCGSYPLRVIAEFPDGSRMVAHEAVHVLQESGSASDSDGDSLPNDYENQRECLDVAVADATLDPDGDGVPSRFEFEEGSNPCNPDSDGGGEMDGSERRAGRGVLDARDDRLRRPVDVYPITQLSEHEVAEPLARNAISLRPPRLEEYASVVLLRGTDPAALNPIATLPSASIGDRYVDSFQLVQGQTYYYQWRGLDADGNEGTPSHVFSIRSMPDTEAPQGAFVLQDGRPRTDDANLQLEVFLYNDEPATTRMQLKTYLCPSEVAMGQPPAMTLPYAQLSTQPAPTVAGPCMVGIGVVLTDADGNASINMTDGIQVWPPGSLGDLRGTLFVAEGTPLRAVIEIPDDPTQPPTYAGEDGVFVLPDLEPGSYDLRVSLLGYESRTVNGVQVLAGQFTELPGFTLVPELDRIFADGFELD